MIQRNHNLKVSPIDEVIAAFKRGEMVIIADDEDRENEGDLVMATDALTAEAVSFMMHQARGLICVSIDAAQATRLNLPLQTLNNNSSFGTPFTVSVDHKDAGESGATAQARTRAMRALVDPASAPEDFVIPGHVFPLIANPAGVIGRQGQTEASCDLARIAGFSASGVVCEILKPDGSMARAPELNVFAEEHGLKVTTVAEIARYRISREVMVRQVASTPLKTPKGEFQGIVFEDDVSGRQHLVMLYGDAHAASQAGGVLVRIHSECLTGDVFESRRCDCGAQLDESMRQIVEAGAGLVIYLRQEGRDIGLANKLKAYALQDQGADTVEANVQLGFAPDERDFAVAAQILNFFGLNRIRLLTNNPDKLVTMQRLGLDVLERLPVITPTDEMSKTYLATKREKMGHLL